LLAVVDDIDSSLELGLDDLPHCGIDFLDEVPFWRVAEKHPGQIAWPGQASNMGCEDPSAHHSSEDSRRFEPMKSTSASP
jgi:hypothetical protein